LVRRLRDAGAIIVGKTNLLEYAYGIAHPVVGQTNNPHDPSRTSGGSSGGSAAAVAAGIVPIAIGTDTGGSIRIPAAYCGIVGLKPTFGLVPLDGVFPLSQSLDHAGPLARSVEDCALALAVLAGMAIERRAVALDGLRVGLVTRHFASAELTTGVRAVIERALGSLRAAGAILVDIEIARLAEANPALRTILRPEASLIHTDLMTLNPAGYAPRTRAQLNSGRYIAAVDYLAALRFRDVLRQEVDQLFGRVDVLISPSVPFVAPFTDPVIEDGAEGEMLASGLANLTGHPTLNLPAGLNDGLPVGLQLMGSLAADNRLLSIASAIEVILHDNSMTKPGRGP
jgi:aspartyl-tRNA(Asn)/glutamyl-tRNA(Gln) amidotransferase subunit A